MSQTPIFHTEEPTTRYISSPVSTTGTTKDPLLLPLQKSLSTATQVQIVVAFTQDSGLRLLQANILDALERGCHIQILTSNYLHITQASALQRLIDWKEQSFFRSYRGLLEIKIFEAANISFHPKAWFFHNPASSHVFVGSSNWSYSALCTGIEWNVCLSKTQHPQQFHSFCRAFDDLWEEALVLTQAWLNNYVTQCTENKAASLPLGEIDPDTDTIEPTTLQKKALQALQQTKAQHNKRGLFVLATGLGKTFLSAFSAKELQATRILFVVHRREILLQAASSFRRIFPHRKFSWCLDNRFETDGDIVFASIQKLSRNEYYQQINPTYFDLIIIDEVHHAAAQSYQSLIYYFTPSFLLGLTATPNRSDHLNILPLFDDNIIFQADLWEGIKRKLLVPFHYIGRLDSINYQSFVKSDGSLDEQNITASIQNHQRMTLLWDICQENPGSQTIFFCSNIAHCDYSARWLKNKGLSVVSVHSGATSAPRLASITRLQKGELDAICVVDLFNEGIDIPSVDRIVMLRPTVSPVLFYQQLGRGLRTSEKKEQLIVIDIIGNHRSFASRIQTLLSLSPQNDFGLWVQGKKKAHLPPDCSFDIEMGIVTFFQNILPQSRNISETLFEQFLFINSHRPTLLEIVQLGANYKELIANTGSWFGFLQQKNSLSPIEAETISKAKHWFSMLETTAMTRSFKMIALQVLIEQRAFQTGIPNEKFCQRCFQMLDQSPQFRNEIPVSKRSPKQWFRYWNKWLLSTWDNEDIVIETRNNNIHLSVSLPNNSLIYDLSQEIIQFRLFQYVLRPSVFKTKHLKAIVSYQRKRLRLSFSTSCPKQWSAQDQEGKMWRFYSKQNIVTKVSSLQDTHQNIIETFITAMFHSNIEKYPAPLHLQFENIGTDWFVKAIEGNPPSFLQKHDIPFFSDFESLKNNFTKHHIRLPIRNTNPLNCFALLSPNSLVDIEKNDWIICQSVSNIAVSLLQNETILFQTHPTSVMSIGVVTKKGSSFAIWFAEQYIPISPTTIIIAKIEHHISPTSLLPLIGTKLLIKDFATTLGVSENPTQPYQLIDGLPIGIVKKETETIRHFSENPHPFVFIFQKLRKYYKYLGLFDTSKQK